MLGEKLVILCYSYDLIETFSLFIIRSVKSS